MNKLTFYAVLIVSAVISFAIFLNHLDKQTEKLNPTERIIHVIPEKMEKPIEFYRLDQDTIMILVKQKVVKVENKPNK